jgi:hypothetical protein
MRLFAWRRSDCDIEFDPASGSAKVLKLSAPRPSEAPCFGFAQFERSIAGSRIVFAVYHQRETVFFSAGASRWPLGSPHIRLEHERRVPFTSRFRVVVAGRPEFSFEYLHIGRWLFELMDPTYDAIDQDSDFFLEFLAEQAGSPQWLGNVRERWLSVP